MYAQGFDPAFTSVATIDYALGIPLTHLAIADPVLPIYVNAYLPPQPSMERCSAFGQALARIVSAMGVTTVVLASGGMSHYCSASIWMGRQRRSGWETGIAARA